MEKECHTKIYTLKVDGGATQNNYLMQFQSDILKKNVLLPTCLETTSLGVCYLAGLENRFWKSLDEIRSIHKYQKEFSPNMEDDEIKEIDKKWKLAIKATRVFK